jgi:hypothetical protein
VLTDLAPGKETAVRMTVNSFFNGQALSDKIVGQVFFNGGIANETQRRNATRHSIIDQLTFDPNFGTLGTLPADVPVVLAWGREPVVEVEVAGQHPSSSANVLYYIPVTMSVTGKTVFQSDLMRSTILSSDAMFFAKDPSSINFGQGSVTMAYRPIAFAGTFTVSTVRLAVGFGGDQTGNAGGGEPVAPMPIECVPPIDPGASAAPLPSDCPALLPIDQFDGIPEIEVFDLTGDGKWRRLPHFQQGATYELDHPERYVDPTSGTIQIRFVNDRQDGVGISFNVSLEGTVR